MKDQELRKQVAMQRDADRECVAHTRAGDSAALSPKSTRF
jgi:hypothetical protein